MNKSRENDAVGREAALTRELEPLMAKLYELDPARASADSDAIVKTLQAAG